MTNMVTLRQFLAILWNVIRDTSRHPPFIMLIVLCIFLILSLPILAVFTFGEELRMVRDSAMATILFIGVFAGVAAASSSVYSEITSETILLTLSKNVARGVFLMAVFFGIVIIMMCFFLAVLPVILIAMRMASNGIITDWRHLWFALLPFAFSLIVAAFMNFKFKKNFYSEFFLYILIMNVLAGIFSKWLIEPQQIPHYYQLFSEQALIKSALLILILLIVSVAFSIMCVTFISPKATIALSCAFMGCGLISGYLQNQYGFLIKMLISIVPDWQLFWIMDGSKISVGYFLTVLLYAAIFISIYLTAGLMIFNSADLATGKNKKTLI